MTLKEHIKEREALDALPEVRGHNWVAEKLADLGLTFVSPCENVFIVTIEEGGK